MLPAPDPAASPADAAPPAAPPATPPAAPHLRLASHREALDQIDARLVELLAMRAELALSIGAAKREAGLPIHAPEREAVVIERAASAATGALDADTAARMFAVIVAETRALQQRQGL